VQNQVEFLVGFDRPTESAGWANAFGSRFSAGVLVGLGLGDDLQVPSSTQRSESNSAIAGILLEFALHGPLSLEADGIYRPLHAHELGTVEGGLRWAVLTWEFPVLAKYKFPSTRAGRLFVELGPSFRLDGNFNGPMPSHYGVTAGAGLEAHYRKLKISPALRYTRWAPPRSPRGGGTFLNQVQPVVALSF
jgi:hypothetical protein